MLAHRKRHFFKGIKKFLFVLAILLAYAGFAIHKFGVSQGIAVTGITWSFFVFCTPIADAGFLLDFPIRVATGLKMVISEVLVWLFAVLLNVITLFVAPHVYDKTPLLQLFHQIITTPWPLWSIIGLSAIGTFISVVIDDEIYDLITAKNKKKQLRKEGVKLAYSVSVFVATFVLYFAVLRLTDTSIHIF